MEGKSDGAMRNVTNVGKKNKSVSPVRHEEVGSFHLCYSAAESV